MSITACEELATKAELQELRDQINQLLGKSYDGTGTIDVLQAQSLAGTEIEGGLARDLEIEEDPKTGEVKIASTYVEGGNNMWWKGITKLWTFQYSLANTLRKTITTTGIAAIKKIESEGYIDDAVEMLTTVAENVNIFGQLSALEQDLADYKQLTEDLASQLYSTKGNLDKALENIEEIERKIEEAERKRAVILNAIAEQAIKIRDVEDIVQQNRRNLIIYKGELEAYETRLDSEVQYFQNSIVELKDYISKLKVQAQKEAQKYDKLLEFTENLAINLAETQGRTTELEDRFTRLAAIQSIQKGELNELKAELGVQTALRQVSTVKVLNRLSALEDRRIGGGGIALTVQESIAGTQNDTITAFAALAGNPAIRDPASDVEIPVQANITYEDIVYGQSSFSQIMNGLTSTFSGLNLGNQVTPDQLNTSLANFGEGLRENIDIDFKTALGSAIALSVAPKLNILTNQTSAASITSAATTAVCNTTAPGGCLTTNLLNPLRNNMNAVGDGINGGLNTLNLLLNNQILARVNATQEFLGKAWNSTAIDKTLNAANTVFALHNALMLSRNLGQTTGDTISLALNALPIKAFDESPIDVNEWVGDRVETLVNGLIGEENADAIGKSFNSANRILTSAQGAISAVHGVKNALQEGQEIIVNRVGILGNTFMEQGIFEDDSYPWMSTNTNFRSPFTGFTQRVQGLTEFVEEVNQLVQTGIEVQEGVNEIFENTTEAVTASQELGKALQQFDLDKKEAEEEAEVTSASPDIPNSALAKSE